jgi:hypothetical protein
MIAKGEGGWSGCAFEDEGENEHTTKLNADRVNEIFLDCLFKEGEDHENHVVAEGIKSKVGFHPERLEGHREEIFGMLKELPEEFMKTSDLGGWSFLNACLDKDGNQWTGFHQRMEQLFQLGMGIGRVECLLPREQWIMFPGGMPYYVVLDGE